jgi:hypothetical protein
MGIVTQCRLFAGFRGNFVFSFLLTRCWVMLCTGRSRSAQGLAFRIWVDFLARTVQNGVEPDQFEAISRKNTTPFFVFSTVSGQARRSGSMIAGLAVLS